MAKAVRVEVSEKDTPFATPPAPRLVLAAFLSSMATLGLSLSYGAFHVHYSSSFPTQHSSVLSLVGGLQLFITFAGGMVPISKSWHPSHSAICGATLCLASWVWLSFAHSFAEVLLSQGVLFGVGSALLYHPPQRLIFHGRESRVSRQVVLASSGPLFGGLFWPVVIRFLFDSSAASRTIPIVGAVSATIAVASCIAIPFGSRCPSPHQAGAGKKSPNGRQAMLSLGLLCSFLGISGTMSYSVSFGIEHGLDLTTSTSMLSLFYAAAMLGNAASCLLENYIHSIYLFTLATALAGLLSVVHPIMISPPAITAFFLLLGPLVGGILTRVATLPSDCITSQRVSWWAIVTPYFGFLLGGPTFGLLLAAGHGGWFGAAFFCGGILLLGSFALLIVGGYWYEDDELATGDTSTMSDEATMVHCRAVSNERVCPKKVMDGAV